MELSLLKGMGEKRLQLLHKMGIFTVEELLSYVPAAYRDMSHISLLQDLQDGDYGLFKVRISTVPQLRRIRGGKSMVTCEVEDISGRCRAVWFNQPYMMQNIKPFEDKLLYGFVQNKKNRLQLTNPAPVSSEEMSITPVYKLPAGGALNQKTLRQLIRQSVDLCNTQQKELFPGDFRGEHKLAERNFAIENIHFPVSFDALEQAKRRMAFEELLLLQIFLRRKRSENQAQEGKVLHLSSRQFSSFLNKLPFAFTRAQNRCCGEIIKDMASGQAMNRLLQGDVGSGKTAVAALAMFIAGENGGQAALMAPTDILAAQHYQELCSWFGEEAVALLTGNLTAPQRRESLERIQNGTAKYIIGTHALIQDKVVFQNLLLVVTDEQHRFGVAQRARLYAKGDSPHTLVMSATPIPRTLSLIIFGDLDISVIDELPPGRQKVSTHTVSRSREQDMFQYIAKVIKEDGQAYFVCPLIEESEEVPARSAEELYALLKEGPFAEIPIALLHGRLTAAEKTDIMEGFAQNKIKALVSTTVIEVGVNVPNATVMVIDGAERFGLAQLHQLRGRVGRGNIKSYCFLLTDSVNASVKERLEFLCKSHDGFAIAEKDLELRGPGDYLGTRQSGLAEAKFSRAFSNTLLVKETQDTLEELLQGENKIFMSKLEAAAQARFERKTQDIVYN